MGTSTGRNNMRIPTNIEDSGEILDDEGNIDGYMEENRVEEREFKLRVDHDVNEDNTEVKDDNKEEPYSDAELKEIKNVT